MRRGSLPRVSFPAAPPASFLIASIGSSSCSTCSRSTTERAQPHGEDLSAPSSRAITRDRRRAHWVELFPGSAGAAYRMPLAEWQRVIMAGRAVVVVRFARFTARFGTVKKPLPRAERTGAHTGKFQYIGIGVGRTSRHMGGAFRRVGSPRLVRRLFNNRAPGKSNIGATVGP